ncbi:prepilin peptidase [Thermodesulfovibrio yellowstonii]|uniref:Prepilin leader peptidase/N-methyltransferase n=1 Tax=Thermodesulfovibrio yellowstonii TaxID=28262 RepID=A0A9W6GG73_9BACT|nr:A24 family peptidase [Thermodesulfovibrio islandicus]GLI53332.1 type 4 prepilin-like proteins leader peptide-processing enzyme [Thermodesulfovibrio islandicus]
MEVLIFLVLGLIVGSFLNVCIYRIPRKISIIKPASFCPACGNSIKLWHNIPVLSFILLKGKCDYCGSRISFRYSFVEILNGIFYVLAYLSFGLTPYLLFILIFISAMIVVSFIDLDFQIIPDQISIPLIFIGFIFSLFSHGYTGFVSDFKESLLGIVVGGGSLLIVSIISKGGMGGGDIKLNAAVGAFLGWKAALLTIFIGSLAGSIVGIIIFKKTGNRKIPFGPFLSIGALICLFLGEKILNWYFG